MTQIQPPPAGSPYPGGPHQQGQPQGGVPYQQGPPPAGLGGPGAPPPGHPAPPRGTNTLAIVALVLAFVVAPVGFVLGLVALAQIRRRGEGGRGLAIAGVVLGAIFTAIGAVAVVLVVNGLSQLNTAAVETEIAGTTQRVVGTTPDAVSCPDSVEIQAGGTFTCTATVDGQQLPFTVAQKDDQGNVAYEQTGWTIVSNAEKQLVDAATRNYPDTKWDADCADGKDVVVGGPGTTFTCTLFIVGGTPEQSEQHTATITSNGGDFTFE